MMNEENVEQLVKNITSISNKNDNINIIYDIVTAIKETHKYSSTRKPIWKLQIDGKTQSRKNPYRISYKCLNCSRDNIINLELFIRKLNNNITKCRTCKELDDIKRQTHSETLSAIYSGEKDIKQKKQKKTIIKLIEESETTFDQMDSDFLEKYLLKHLTKEEFERIRKKILSFQKGKIPNRRIYLLSCN